MKKLLSFRLIQADISANYFCSIEVLMVKSLNSQSLKFFLTISSLKQKQFLQKSCELRSCIKYKYEPLPVAVPAFQLQSCGTLNIGATIVNIISNAKKIIIMNFLSVTDNTDYNARAATGYFMLIILKDKISNLKIYNNVMFFKFN